MISIEVIFKYMISFRDMIFTTIQHITDLVNQTKKDILGRFDQYGSVFK